MPIDAECPGCATAFKVPDRLAGKLIRCKSCREEFRVGGDDDAIDDEPRPRRRARAKSSVMPVALIVGGVVLFGLVIAVGLAAWVWMSPKPSPYDPNLGPAKRSYTGATMPISLMPDRRGRTGNDPAAGDQIAVLSNMRRAESVFGDAAFDVDYSFGKGPPSFSDQVTVKVRTSKGGGQFLVAGAFATPQGTWRIVLLSTGAAGPGGKIELWLEKGSGGQRVSNVVSVDR